MDALPSPSMCFPRPAGPVFLDRISAEELVSLRRMEDEEGFARLTCRPVQMRTETELLTLYRSALEDENKLVCGIFLPGTDGPIGKLTASDFNPRNRSAELGYFLAPAYRGNGCMAKALDSFCSLLLEEAGLNKVYAQTGAFNTASIRLLERSGFQRDGILRQHHELDGVLYDDCLYSRLSAGRGLLDAPPQN